MSKTFNGLMVPVNGNGGSRARIFGKRSIAHLLGFHGKDAGANHLAAVAEPPRQSGPFSGKIRFKTR